MGLAGVLKGGGPSHAWTDERPLEALDEGVAHGDDAGAVGLAHAGGKADDFKFPIDLLAMEASLGFFLVDAGCDLVGADAGEGAEDDPCTEIWFDIGEDGLQLGHGEDALFSGFDFYGGQALGDGDGLAACDALAEAPAPEGDEDGADVPLGFGGFAFTPGCPPGGELGEVDL